MRRSLTTYSPSYYKLSVSQQTANTRLLCTSYVAAAEKGDNIEMAELVDDFVTFYLAGNLKTPAW